MFARWADLSERLLGPAVAPVAPAEQRQFDVLQRGFARQQMKGLKTKPMCRLRSWPAGSR